MTLRKLLVFASLGLASCSSSPAPSSDRKEPPNALQSNDPKKSPALQKSESTAPKPALIPYDSLKVKGLNPALQNLSGWNIAKDIHEKQGFASNQSALVNYKRLLGQSKADINDYLGQPKGQDGDDVIYESDFGNIRVSFQNDRASSVMVSFSRRFPGYVDVLRGIGINALARPMAMNETLLLFNSNFGNALTAEKPFSNVLVYLPDNTRKGTAGTGWAIMLTVE